MAEGGKGEKLNRAEISNQGKADYKVEQIRGSRKEKDKQRRPEKGSSKKYEKSKNQFREK